MATTNGFHVGAQRVNAFTASGLSVGTPVRIQNLTGGVMHYCIGATAPLFIQIECYEGPLDLPL